MSFYEAMKDSNPWSFDQQERLCDEIERNVDPDIDTEALLAVLAWAHLQFSDVSNEDEAILKAVNILHGFVSMTKSNAQLEAIEGMVEQHRELLQLQGDYPFALAYTANELVLTGVAVVSSGDVNQIGPAFMTVTSLLTIAWAIIAWEEVHSAQWQDIGSDFA